MNDQRNNGDHKQEVNSATCDVESKPPHQPHGQQKKKRHQKYKVPYCSHLLLTPTIDKQSDNRGARTELVVIIRKSPHSRRKLHTPIDRARKDSQA
jgi:hypothetical protein